MIGRCYYDYEDDMQNTYVPTRYHDHHHPCDLLISEARRRMDDEELRRSRLAKLQREALASAKANAAIEMKWGEKNIIYDT